MEQHWQVIWSSNIITHHGTRSSGASWFLHYCCCYCYSYCYCYSNLEENQMLVLLGGSKLSLLLLLLLIMRISFFPIHKSARHPKMAPWPKSLKIPKRSSKLFSAAENSAHTDGTGRGISSSLHPRKVTPRGGEAPRCSPHLDPRPAGPRKISTFFFFVFFSVPAFN